ncbi:sialidase family protein [Arthrobacter sp. UM1]|uniref:sialidase family protein n=1 Tax=Arthrobacter sp. UM1 TaxID=2766776 RepID=UPI001CF6DF20|nr:sialidase family protein [Arthrobacter sp. UM1]MCB4209024.1 exo-alpha-sialidase [Arthrobacter sp. UM1]
MLSRLRAGALTLLLALGLCIEAPVPARAEGGGAAGGSGSRAGSGAVSETGEIRVGRLRILEIEQVPHTGDPGEISRSALRQFPFAVSLPRPGSAPGDPRVVLLSYNGNFDAGEYEEQIRLKRSEDGGRTWENMPQAVPMTNVAVLGGGALYSVNFRTAPRGSAVQAPVPPRDETASDARTDPDARQGEEDREKADREKPGGDQKDGKKPGGTSKDKPAEDSKAAPKSNKDSQPGPKPNKDSQSAPKPKNGPKKAHKEFTTLYWRSEDAGRRWTEHQGRAFVTEPFESLYFHRGVLVAPDGEWLVPAYGHKKGQRHYTSLLMSSKDKGETWKSVSQFGEGVHGGEGVTEPSVEFNSRGELVAVYRVQATVNPRICRGRHRGTASVMTVVSKDRGRTWGPARRVRVDGHRVGSADPHLVRLPTGQLLLSVGRPLNQLLVSEDGTGDSWTLHADTGPSVTSGYTSVVPSGRGSELLQIGDLGSNWCFSGPAGSRATRSAGLFVQPFTVSSR